MAAKSELVEMTIEIVAAYVGANTVGAHDLPRLIETVYGALSGIAGRIDGEAHEALAPAVPIKRSVMPDYIVCLEDGEKFKSLKRHLRTRYSMTPDEYRARWNLPHDYPMVAPNYAKARSDLAKRMGLGHGRRGA